MLDITITNKRKKSFYINCEKCTELIHTNKIRNHKCKITPVTKYQKKLKPKISN